MQSTSSPSLGVVARVGAEEGLTGLAAGPPILSAHHHHAVTAGAGAIAGVVSLAATADVCIGDEWVTCKPVASVSASGRSG